MIDANAIVGTHDIVLITLDTLRYDVAQRLWRNKRTPNLVAFSDSGWEPRHTPGNFTFAAHAAFFAGFLPTTIQPVGPGTQKPERLFAVRFSGSETTSPRTCVFETPDIVSGLASRGYHTTCIQRHGIF